MVLVTIIANREGKRAGVLDRLWDAMGKGGTVAGFESLMRKPDVVQVSAMDALTAKVENM